MESKNFSLNSWHWKLISTFGTLRGAEYVEVGETYSTDICAYIRAVLKALVLLCFVLVICGAAIFLTAHGLAYAAAVIINAQIIPPLAPALVFWFLVTVATIASSLIYAHTKYVEWKDDRDFQRLIEKKPDSFMTSAYRKFKDKTCFRINVE